MALSPSDKDELKGAIAELQAEDERHNLAIRGVIRRLKFLTGDMKTTAVIKPLRSSTGIKSKCVELSKKMSLDD